MSDSVAQSATFLPAELASPEELLQSIVSVSLTGVMLLHPLYELGEEEPTDFVIAYLNPVGQDMLGLAERPKNTLLQSFSHLKASGVWGFYLQVLKTSEAGQFEVDYQHDGLNNFFYIAARPAGRLLVVSFSDTAHQDRSVVEQTLRESQASEKKARAEAELQRQQLYNVFMQTPAMICIFEGPRHVFKLVNPPYQQLVGDRPLLGKPIAEAMPELKGQSIFKLLDGVYQTGESFHAHEMMVQLDHNNEGGGALGENYYNFTYQATRNLAGEIDGVLVFAYEVTAQVHARQLVEQSHQQVKELNQQLEMRVAQRTQALELAQAEAERQRKRLELMFMQAPAAICILNGPELVYELVNPAYQQLFPGRQLLGKPILEALPEIADNPVYRTFRQVYDTGVTHEEQGLLIPIMRPEDGVKEERYFKYIQQARINEQGQIDGVLVFAFEITEQVMSRKAIEANARQLKLITDSLPVLIGYLDKDEKYRFANQAYKAWFNQPPETLLGRPVREVVGEKAYSGVKKHIDRALAGERLDFEAHMPYRENFTKHIRASYVPDVQQGAVVGFYTLVTDVTGQVEAREAVRESEQQAKSLARELAAANKELQEANQQLIRTNVDLDNFIYTASHDLKAPILNIAGLMDVLQSQLPPEVLASPSPKHIMELISTSIKRFRRTIDHLTDITKLQKENNLEVSSVNLAAIIADVQLDLEPAIREINAKISVDVAGCPTIRFSEKNMRSIVYNLFSNAVKYHATERQLEVQISCEEADGYQVLTVQDNGMGIDLSKEHKLFAMFKRLHSHVEGSGVGLYMVKKILENAGGKIEVQSEVGKGATFKAFIPHQA